MRDAIKRAADAAKAVQVSISNILPLPSEVVPANEWPVLPPSLFGNTRGYLEAVVAQVNRCYSSTCYDASAVMIRRLLEVLIIECFEENGLRSKVVDANGDYFLLDELTKRCLSETQWSLGRVSKQALRTLKTIGDQSAHSRRYNARREYIDNTVVQLRTLCEELLYIAHLRR
jgi:hypothetical protein